MYIRTDLYMDIHETNETSIFLIYHFKMGLALLQMEEETREVHS